MLQSRTFTVGLLLLLLFSIAPITNSTLLAQSNGMTYIKDGVNTKINNRQFRKELRIRKKGNRDQGYKPDLSLGSDELQFRKIIRAENTVYGTDNKPLYFMETFEAEAKNKALGIEKTRAWALDQFLQHGRNYISGMISKEGMFINGDQEDISGEIMEMLSVDDRIFEDIVSSRNEVISRFYKDLPNGYCSVRVTIVFNKQDLEKAVKNLKKTALNEKLEKLRKKKDAFFAKKK